ncbi:MAG: hypothetical protein QNJ97_23175 [Myxococcota bacterium]|nr:hypothetical protein [Myxococcota bacterium]
MKRTTIFALMILGGAILIGLSILFGNALPDGIQAGHVPGIIAPLLVISVAAALFVFGIFLGYLYGESVRGAQPKKTSVDRFQDALKFERKERLRLERELLESKQVIVHLKDRLAARGSVAPQMEPHAANGATTQLASEQGREAEDLTERCLRLQNELNQRKHRVADLLTEISITQAEADAAKKEVDRLTAASQARALPSIPPDASPQEVLQNIAGLDGIKVALVADDHGLMVASAGKGIASDTLAAISTLVADFGPRTRDILPMEEIATISLKDIKGLTLDTHYFDLMGARYALAIAREDTAHPYPGLAKSAVEVLQERFEE